MLGLAAPVWLAALAALAVPLVIHLWSHRARRVVRLGTLRHLAGAPAARALRLRITEPLLLALRMATLTVLVLFLAGLFLRRADRAEETIVLVAPEVLRSPEALTTDPVLDSLRRADTPIRLLATGFPRAALGPAGPDAGSAPSPDSWALLEAADTAFPSATGLLIVSPAELGDGSGPRPTVRPVVRWHVPELFRGSRIEAAWADADSVRLIARAVSDSGWTITRRFLALRRPEPGVPSVADRVEARTLADGGVEVRLLPGDRALPATFVRAMVLPSRRVVIAAEASREEDARYLRAALRTLRALGVPVEVTSGAQPAPLDSGDWLVHLGPGNPPAEALTALRRGVHLLTDAGDPSGARPVTSAIILTGASAVSPLRLRTGAPVGEGVSLADESGGEPVLTAEAVGEGVHYRFHARFHPEWTGLVLDAGMADLALALIAPEIHRTLTRAEPVRVDIAEILPTQAGRGASGSETALATPLLVLAALLFFTERLLATRRHGTEAAR